MKKKSPSRIGLVLKTIVNVPLWIDWSRCKSITLYLALGIKKLFVPQVATASETFAQAQKRLNLSDKDILARQKGLLRLAILTVCVAVLLLVYAVYQAVFGSILGLVISITVTLIAVVLTFRYHFWYFQFKERKLGCTVKEWYSQSFKGGKK